MGACLLGAAGVARPLAVGRAVLVRRVLAGALGLGDVGRLRPLDPPCLRRALLLPPPPPSYLPPTTSHRRPTRESLASPAVRFVFNGCALHPVTAQLLPSYRPATQLPPSYRPATAQLLPSNRRVGGRGGEPEREALRMPSDNLHLAPLPRASSFASQSAACHPTTP